MAINNNTSIDYTIYSYYKGIMKLNIKALREREGMSQEALAGYMNMGIDTLRRVEANNGRLVNKKQIDRFCVVLRCNIENLITVERV